MREIWKPVIGYEKLYKISNLGRIKSLKYRGGKKQKILSTYNVHGYKRVRLFDGITVRSTGVHRIVAEAFLANPDSKQFVNHKDGNKSNNHLDNLEWATRSENAVHAFRILHIKRGGGVEKRAVKNTDTGEIYSSIQEAAEKTGHNRTSIISCCKGRYKTVNGQHWKYVN